LLTRPKGDRGLMGVPFESGEQWFQCSTSSWT
jgi:hypothetical protein